jgi:hypothetical protein
VSDNIQGLARVVAIMISFSDEALSIVCAAFEGRRGVSYPVSHRRWHHTNVHIAIRCWVRHPACLRRLYSEGRNVRLRLHRLDSPRMRREGFGEAERERRSHLRTTHVLAVADERGNTARVSTLRSSGKDRPAVSSTRSLNQSNTEGLSDPSIGT